jgi:hypothetical protein
MANGYGVRDLKWGKNLNLKKPSGYATLIKFIPGEFCIVLDRELSVYSVQDRDQTVHIVIADSANIVTWQSHKTMVGIGT